MADDPDAERFFAYASEDYDDQRPWPDGPVTPPLLVKPSGWERFGQDDRHAALYAAAVTHAGQPTRLVTLAAGGYLKWLRDSREDPDG